MMVCVWIGVVMFLCVRAFYVMCGCVYVWIFLVGVWISLSVVVCFVWIL